jgi:hypothetical protein
VSINTSETIKAGFHVSVTSQIHANFHKIEGISPMKDQKSRSSRGEPFFLTVERVPRLPSRA